ncbi:hypothetical protein [Kitasatospora sp. NPDC090091]|uniref:hypothetical protein n=1 Tax=Kitasatospora sp. NPDC090091 TaxID=3364081 RepID=UPI00382E5B75
MLPKTVRGVVEVAAGLVEEVGKRVVGTAAELLEKTGVDVAGVERKLGGQFPPSPKALQTLVEEAVTAGRAGVDLAVGVARGEVERAFEKVGDQVTKVGVVLAYLESKLREVEGEAVPAARTSAAEEPAPAPRADGLFGRGWEKGEEPAAPATRAGAESIVAERVEVDAPVEVDPPVPPARTAPEPKAAPEPDPAAGNTVAAKPAQTGKSPAGKSPAGKAAEKKAAAKKAAAGTAPAEKAPVKKAATKKTAAKKTVAKRTVAKKTAAGQEAPAKRTATKKTTVRKTSTTKKPDA